MSMKNEMKTEKERKSLTISENNFLHASQREVRVVCKLRDLVSRKLLQVVM